MSRREVKQGQALPEIKPCPVCGNIPFIIRNKDGMKFDPKTWKFDNFYGTEKTMWKLDHIDDRLCPYIFAHSSRYLKELIRFWNEKISCYPA